MIIHPHKANVCKHKPKRQRYYIDSKSIFAITMDPNNKIKAYPRLTGNGILYQANNGNTANTAIDSLHIKLALFLSVLIITTTFFYILAHSY